MKIPRFLSSLKLPLFLILVGIVLRFSNYIYNRSLWTDEAWVANDILSRTFKEIFFNDISHVILPAIPPVGFLLVEKLLVHLLGNSEYVLRLFPLLCATSAVALYWILLKKWTDHTTAIIALSFFVFSGSLINYSAECKQYSTEMFTCIVLYLAATYFQSRPASIGRVLIFALIGMAGMFISHTAIFILGGIGIAHIISLFNGGERKLKRGYLFTYFLWLVCFVLIYFVYLRVMVKQGSPIINASLINFIPAGGIFTLGAWKWLWNSILGFFQYPLGMSPIVLAISMFILGAAGIFKSDKKTFFMLVIPMILMIIAAVLKKFPFYGRFLLFLMPAAFLFISQGISMVIGRGKISLILGVIIFFILMGHLLNSAMSNEVNPQGREEMRPLVGVLLKDQFPGDTLFLNNSAQYAYKYYLKYYRSDLSPYKEGYFFDFLEQGKVTLISNAMSSQGILLRVHIYRKTGILKKSEYRFKQRTWLMLTHLYNQETEQFIKGCFDDRGKILAVFKRPGASLYLYELYEPLIPIQGPRS